VSTNRRTFLVGLGRFAVGAAALGIAPPVLYSFPTGRIRLANTVLHEPTIMDPAGMIRYVTFAAGNWIAITAGLDSTGHFSINTSPVPESEIPWNELSSSKDLMAMIQKAKVLRGI